MNRRSLTSSLAHLTFLIGMLSMSTMSGVATARALNRPHDLAGGSEAGGSEEGATIAATGELTVVQDDDFDNNRGKLSYSLQEMHSGRVYELRFAHRPPPGLRTGSLIRVQGIARGVETIEVDEGAAGTFETLTTTAALVSGEQRTVVLALNFIDATLECPRTFIEGQMFTNVQSVNGLYQETSNSNLWVTGQVSGPFTINYSSTGVCDPTGYALAADAAAQAAGIDLSLFNRKMYVIPRLNTCGWAGRGTIGGNPSRAWIARCDLVDVYAHELGHNLTMLHSSTDTNNDGTNDCEYCDSSDFMGYAGYGFRQVNAPHKEQMGWLPSSKIVTVGDSGVFTIAPLELKPSDTPYPQTLKIARPATGDFYYLSYRQRRGYDSNLVSEYVDRMNVHHYGGSGLVQSYYISAPLDGGSFVDPAIGLTVTPLSHGSDFLTVQVSLGSGCLSIAPTVSISPATQNAQPGAALSYTVSVKNNDLTSCSLATFGLSAAAPPGWMGTVTPMSLSLAPGQTASATLTIISPSDAASAPYTVGVSVVDGINSAHNASVSATHVVDVVPPVDSVPPTSPANLRARARVGRIQLSWTASTDDVAVTGYSLWRNGTVLSTITATGYLDTAVVKGATYVYYVTARDAAGNVSGPSQSVTARPK